MVFNATFNNISVISWLSQNDYIDSPPRPKPPGNLKTISSGGTGNTVSILLRENQNNRTRGLRSLNNGR
jgi:hypothetical protein